jgi:alkanesulfonate monooxygenase SsuD/methylene tetrahydromethanopterin reductase-like flavin-dependent oxidoreductase (luciferase family)
MAAQLGLPFAYAHFFGIAVEEGPAIAANYREHFKPSQYLSEPKINVGVHVICAETEEDAQRLAGPRNLARLQNITGRAKGIPTMEEALSYQYTPDEYRFVQQYAQVCVDGDPQQVKEQLGDIAEMYQTNDLSIVTITHDYADRKRSYELVADACGYLGDGGE